VRHRLAQTRARVHEGVELAVFPAGIDLLRQVAQQVGVELPPCELAPELPRIYAHEYGAVPQPDELVRESRPSMRSR